MPIKNIFLDLDDTILDFHAGERAAITATLMHFGTAPTTDKITLYRSVNRECWEALERGEMTREEVLVKRFEIFFANLGNDIRAEEVQHFYERQLAESDIFIDGALDLLESLHGKYNLYITSNGTAFVQDRRIEKTGLSRYFDGIFISERIGFNKPSREYFDACFDRMENKSREETIILGDSLTSDILGGINAGIHTCHITGGKNFEYSDIVPENSINTPLEFLGILEKIV